MTKLLFCELCKDIIQPFPVPKKIRWCYCGIHGCWIENNVVQTLHVFEKNKEKHTVSFSILGIHNEFLEMGSSTGNITYKEYIKNILLGTSDYYLFKDWNSVIVKVVPGMVDGIIVEKEIPEDVKV